MAFTCLADEFRQKTWKHRSMEIPLFTEYMRNGVIFRAHPFYSKSETPWHDWVMLRFSKDKHNHECPTYKPWLGDDAATAANHSYAPAKILLFCQDPNDNNIYAVCLCCAFAHKESSAITTHWKIEYIDKSCKKPYLAYIDVNSFVRQVMMVPENQNLNGYHEVWERSEWAKSFL